MTTQPETIASQIIDELRFYGRSNRMPSQFTIAKFKRDADKLKNISRAEAAMIHGMIACLDRDVETCKKQHELSIQLKSDPYFYLNYFGSLCFLSHLHDAHQCIQKALVNFPYSPDIIKAAIRAALFLGLYSEVIEYYKVLKKIHPTECDQQVERYVTDAEGALSIGIPTDTLHNLACILENISIKYTAKTLSILLSTDDGSLIQWVQTSADVDTTVNMNFDLCEALAENKSNFNNISVVFRAFQYS